MINVKDIFLSTVMRSGVKWSDVYHSEQDLVMALQHLELSKYTERGEEIVANLQHVLNKQGSLTPKQMTQLKRVSKFIYIHYKRKQSSFLQILK